VDGTPRLSALIVLGATGSIGRQALEVAGRLDLPVVGLAASRLSPEFAELAEKYPDASLALAGGTDDQRRDFAPRFGDRIGFGGDAVAALAATPGTVVVNGIVGSAGLAPSVAALEAGNRLALANKESLVAGGPVVLGAAERGGGELIPVDSEHSALWQTLVGEDAGSVRRLILTASGGPFRGRTAEQLRDVTVAEALAHPTWDMGPRITIDSATLMNKAFEVVEAHLLFGTPYDAIDVVVHPQSVVHSLVEFVDGSAKAQLGDPDMRVPIQYAITYPERDPAPIAPLDLAGSALTFEAPDRAAFPCLDLGFEAGRLGGSAPAVLNAADEVAVAAFLEERISFRGISQVVAGTLDEVQVIEVRTVEDVLGSDAEARRVAAGLVADSVG
jgi:1-deoxy-D-xylulose-5-phosphate reductoisomerase